VVNADAHLRDCLPSLATRGSDRQPDLHLLRHGAVDDGEGIYVIMVLGGIVLDDVTQPGHMVVHAHHHAHLLRYGAVDDGEGIYVIMVLGGIVLDDVTQPGHMVARASPRLAGEERLQAHL
jgi:hypothetical protein